MSGVTRPALPGDLAWLAPAAVRAHLVDSPSMLAALIESESWRVRVTGRGEGAVLGRWREHLDDLAILGLWCSPSRVPVLVCDLIEVARSQGFGRLLGPLVPEGQVAPYLQAGLHIVERVDVLRLDHPERIIAIPAPAGASIREAGPADLDAIVRLDRASFPAFWRYDRDQLSRLLASGRGAVAWGRHDVIGYTLATVSGVEGSLGRLAVAPGERRRGCGAALATEAISWLASQGARAVTLSTQSDNEASAHLYGSLGFRRSPGTLVACASGPLG